MMASKRKGHHPPFGRKCVNSNQELRSSSFNDGFYRFWPFSTASVATPLILNEIKCLRAAQNALAGCMLPAGRSLPIPDLTNELMLTTY